MADPNRQVAPQNEKRNDIRALITSESMRMKIAEVLPQYLTAEQMTRVMVGQIARVPKLAECSPESLLNALMLCAQAGILPDGRNAHLIPYGQTVTVIFDYKGLIQIAERNGVQNIRAVTVHKKDLFEYGIDGATVEFKWKPNFREDRGDIIAFVGTCIRDGNADVEIMTKAEVDAIRKRSRASGSGPWVTDYAEMGKKTVLRRMSKRWPLSPEQSQAVEREAEEEALPANNKDRKPDFGDPGEQGSTEKGASTLAFLSGAIPEKAPEKPKDPESTAPGGGPAEQPAAESTTPAAKPQPPESKATPQEQLANLIKATQVPTMCLLRFLDINDRGNFKAVKDIPDNIVIQLVAEWHELFEQIRAS